MKIERKEFEGNVLITISDHEVRIWVCNKARNSTVFRFKAMGKVYRSEQDITVLPCPDACPGFRKEEGPKS